MLCATTACERRGPDAAIEGRGEGGAEHPDAKPQNRRLCADHDIPPEPLAQDRRLAVQTRFAIKAMQENQATAVAMRIA